jgi:hypothetical protein
MEYAINELPRALAVAYVCAAMAVWFDTATTRLGLATQLGDLTHGRTSLKVVMDLEYTVLSTT